MRSIGIAVTLVVVVIMTDGSGVWGGTQTLGHDHRVHDYGQYWDYVNTSVLLLPDPNTSIGERGKLIQLFYRAKVTQTEPMRLVILGKVSDTKYVVKKVGPEIIPPKGGDWENITITPFMEVEKGDKIGFYFSDRNFLGYSRYPNDSAQCSATAYYRSMTVSDITEGMTVQAEITEECRQYTYTVSFVSDEECANFTVPGVFYDEYKYTNPVHTIAIGLNKNQTFCWEMDAPLDAHNNPGPEVKFTPLHPTQSSSSYACYARLAVKDDKGKLLYSNCDKPELKYDAIYSVNRKLTVYFNTSMRPNTPPSGQARTYYTYMAEVQAIHSDSIPELYYTDMGYPTPGTSVNLYIGIVAAVLSVVLITIYCVSQQKLFKGGGSPDGPIVKVFTYNPATRQRYPVSWYNFVSITERSHLPSREQRIWEAFLLRHPVTSRKLADVPRELDTARHRQMREWFSRLERLNEEHTVLAAHARKVAKAQARTSGVTPPDKRHVVSDAAEHHPPPGEGYPQRYIPTRDELRRAALQNQPVPTAATTPLYGIAEDPPVSGDGEVDASSSIQAMEVAKYPEPSRVPADQRYEMPDDVTGDVPPVPAAGDVYDKV